MKPVAWVIGAGLIGLALPSFGAAPAAAAPAASRYYPFVGHWTGRGTFSEAGQKPVNLVLKLSCSKAAAGWAVRCNMVARNGELVISEADLFGVDPITGRGHWYAVSNQGETQDLITEWSNAKTMKATYSWHQKDRLMHEHITVTLPDRRSLEFRSIESADRKETVVFTGKLRR